MGISSRLTDYAWDLAYGKGELVTRICEIQGKTIRRTTIDQTIAISEGSFTAGIIPGNRNPVDSLLSIMIALYGPTWAMFLSDDFTHAMKEIDKRWKAKRMEVPADV